jgi:hypothetical protein
MRSRKRILAIMVMLALIVPYGAMAGQAPSAQVRNPVGGNTGVISGYSNVQGHDAYGGLLFWYQYYSLIRWLSHWGIAL